MADVDPLPPAAQEMLLKELRDLQMPEPLSWWPPAPGWWVIAAAVLAVLCYLLLRVRRHREATRFQREARDTFNALHESWSTTRDNSAYLNGTAALLRQVAIRSRGRERVAGLTGNAWIEELSALSSAPLSAETTTALTAGRYRSSSSPDIGRIHGEIKTWLNQLKAASDV